MRKLSTDEIELTMRQIKRMGDPTAQALAFAQLMWRAKRLPAREAEIVFGYDYSGEKRRRDNGHSPKDGLIKARSQAWWWEFGDWRERELWEIFWKFLEGNGYDLRRRWWREGNLEREIEKVKGGVGLIKELAKLFGDCRP